MLSMFLFWLLASALPLVLGIVSGFFYATSRRISFLMLSVALVIEAVLLANFWPRMDGAREEIFFAVLLWMFCAGFGIRCGESLWDYVQVTNLEDDLALPTSIRGND